MAEPLSGAERYRQAQLKARLVWARGARAYDRGEAGWIVGLREREFLIRELDRAYEAGQRARPVAELNTTEEAK